MCNTGTMDLIESSGRPTFTDVGEVTIWAIAAQIPIFMLAEGGWLTMIIIDGALVAVPLIMINAYSRLTRRVRPARAVVERPMVAAVPPLANGYFVIDVEPVDLDSVSR